MFYKSYKYVNLSLTFNVSIMISPFFLQSKDHSSSSDEEGGSKIWQVWGGEAAMFLLVTMGTNFPSDTDQ